MTVIRTIGHGTLPLESFIALLKQHEIQVVVDVRSEPFSARAPHFNRRTLEAALRGAGVTYRWAGETLGGRPPSHLRTKSGAPDYERMSREPETARDLDHLAEASKQVRVALMCSEGNPAECHRSRMLEPELASRGVQIEHVLRNGELLAQPTIFA